MGKITLASLSQPWWLWALVHSLILVGGLAAQSTNLNVSVKAQLVETSITQPELEDRNLPDFSFDRDVEVTTEKTESASGPPTSSQWIVELNYGYRGPAEQVEVDTFILDYATCRVEVPDSPIVSSTYSILPTEESLVVVMTMDVDTAVKRSDSVIHPERESQSMSSSRSAKAYPTLGFCAHITIRYQGILVKVHHTKVRLDLHIKATSDSGGGAVDVQAQGEEPSNNSKEGLPISASITNSTSYVDLRDTPPEEYQEESLAPATYDHKGDIEVDIPPEDYGLAIPSNSASSNEDYLLPIVFFTIGGVAIVFAVLYLVHLQINRGVSERKEMLNNFLDLEDDDACGPNNSKQSRAQQKQEIMLSQFFDGSSYRLIVGPDNLPPVWEGVPQNVTQPADAVSLDVSGIASSIEASQLTQTTTERKWIQSPMRRNSGIEEERRCKTKQAPWTRECGEEEDVDSKRSVASRKSVQSATSRKRSSKNSVPAQLIENKDGVFLGTDAATVVSQASKRSLSRTVKSDLTV